MEHHITIRSPKAELAATLHYPDVCGTAGASNNNGTWPIVVVCHGFIGSRVGENRLFVKASRRLSSLGFMVLRFDYGGCGESTGDYGAGGMNALIEETRSVLDYALSLDCVDPSRVILLGHSLGGATALLVAARDHRVKKLVMWSAVAHPHNDIVNIAGRDEYARLTKEGDLDHNGYSLTHSFFDSLAEHQPFIQLRKFSGDVFVVHGTADEVIPVDYAPLYQNSFWLRDSGRCDMHLVFQADHTYSSQSAVDELLHHTSEWLLQNAARKDSWNDWVI